MTSRAANNRTRIAILGAGPIGLEAGLHFTVAGHDVRIYEREIVAGNVSDWGHVKMFSPFGMNSSVLGRESVSTAHGCDSLPQADELLTGCDYADRYLRPLSRTAELTGKIHEHTSVIAIGRSHLRKADRIGDASRGEEPFHLLLHSSAGENTATADVVFDCTGVFGNHNWVGAGGIPCPGEQQALRPADYRLPDLLGIDRSRFAGRTTLVVGSGFSAATAVVALAELAASDSDTRVIWITNPGDRAPIARLPEDSLTERDRLAAAANRLAVAATGPIDWQPGCFIRRIEFDKSTGIYAVSVEKAGEPKNREEKTLRVDRVIANVGYRPDRNLYEELQFHECYATQGSIKLAATLLEDSSPDCLQQQSRGADALRNPEPGFFILGAKSYGRDSRFLIGTGLEQIKALLPVIPSSSTRKE